MSTFYIEIGKVLKLLSGNDGDTDAEYEVEYEEDHEKYIVSDLKHDYLEGSLKFL